MKFLRRVMKTGKFISWRFMLTSLENKGKRYHVTLQGIIV